MYRRETTFRVGNRTLCHFFLQVLAKLQIFGAGCGSVGEKAVMMEEAFRLLHACSYHGFFSQRLQYVHATQCCLCYRQFPGVVLKRNAARVQTSIVAVLMMTVGRYQRPDMYTAPRARRGHVIMPPSDARHARGTGNKSHQSVYTEKRRRPGDTVQRPSAPRAPPPPTKPLFQPHGPRSQGRIHKGNRKGGCACPPAGGLPSNEILLTGSTGVRVHAKDPRLACQNNFCIIV